MLTRHAAKHQGGDLLPVLLLGMAGAGAFYLISQMQSDDGTTGGTTGDGGWWFWPTGSTDGEVSTETGETPSYTINYPKFTGTEAALSYVADVGASQNAANTGTDEISITAAKKDALVALQTGDVETWNSYVSSLAGSENLTTDSSGRIRTSSDTWIEAFSVAAEQNGIEGKQGSEAIAFYSLMASAGPNDTEKAAAGAWLDQHEDDPNYNTSSKKAATVSSSGGSSSSSYSLSDITTSRSGGYH